VGLIGSAPRTSPCLIELVQLRGEVHLPCESLLAGPTRLRGWHARRRRRPSPHYPYVYVDSNGGAATVDGAALTGTGSVFCTDGSFTGYSCGATVTQYNVCANVSEGSTVYNVCNLDIADADHQIVQSGESGGTPRQ